MIITGIVTEFQHHCQQKIRVKISYYDILICNKKNCFFYSNTANGTWKLYYYAIQNILLKNLMAFRSITGMDSCFHWWERSGEVIIEPSQYIYIYILLYILRESSDELTSTFWFITTPLSTL